MKAKITKKGSDMAYPAIWYAGMVNQIFEVKKSEKWSGIYEVTTGTHKRRLIPKSDCEIINETLKNKNH